MPTKVYYVHGPDASSKQYRFGKSGLIPNTGEFRGRDTNIQKSFFNYGFMTEGEFEAMLLLRMLEIDKAAYKDPNGIYQKGIDEINNRLYTGLHTGARGFTGSVPKELNKVFSKLQRAISKNTPAGLVLAENPNIRTRIGNGFDPNDAPVNEADCQAIYNNYLSAQAAGVGSGVLSGILEQYNACGFQNNDIRALNESFPDSGHHLLYAFDPQLQYSANPRYGLKASIHESVISRIEDNTALSKNNLLSWIRYGVKLNNYKGNTLPFEPEESIEILRQKAVLNELGYTGGPNDQEPRIGFPWVFAIAAAAIITLRIVKSADEGRRMKFSLNYLRTLDELGLETTNPNAVLDFINSLSDDEYLDAITTLGISTNLFDNDNNSGNNGGGNGGNSGDNDGGDGNDGNNNTSTGISTTTLAIGAGLLYAITRK